MNHAHDEQHSSRPVCSWDKTQAEEERKRPAGDDTATHVSRDETETVDLALVNILILISTAPMSPSLPRLIRP